jgi:hypothetical protein
VLDGLRVKDADPLPVEGLSVPAFQSALENWQGKT